MTTESKPREWTLFDGHTAEAREFIKGSDIAYAENPKVIEKSAYDQLQAELKAKDELLRECEKALEHYANKRISEGGTARAYFEKWKKDAKT